MDITNSFRSLNSIDRLGDFWGVVIQVCVGYQQETHCGKIMAMIYGLGCVNVAVFE